ncbi:hypothetical protein EDB83DRAFT_2316960 [Lactarius deliciosus]|nr:hypothetical protein EDB83DRAFT_2316960 [Lactarius deliciosus]
MSRGQMNYVIARSRPMRMANGMIGADLSGAEFSKDTPSDHCTSSPFSRITSSTSCISTPVRSINYAGPGKGLDLGFHLPYKDKGRSKTARLVEAEYYRMWNG